MAKKKITSTNGTAPKLPKELRTNTKKQASQGSGNPIADFFASKSVRETIESVAIAFVLAFLFRTFEAEAFVIPTGSMAHTLMGRHKDVVCPECGYQYTTGNSERRDQSDIVGTTCPNCRYIHRFKPGSSEAPDYTGDRILVSKFIYDVSKPRRWDVVVFKFPQEAKTNYIKRLTGLPGETVRLYHGDLWTKPLEANDDEFQIARKPAAKVRTMLQVVHDTHYIPSEMSVDKNLWPRSWQDNADRWKVSETPRPAEDGTTLDREFFITANDAISPSWLRYHHYWPSNTDWLKLQAGQKPPTPNEQLITDFYAYNASIPDPGVRNMQPRSQEEEAIIRQRIADATYESGEALGLHWVGDLAIETDLEVTDDGGQLFLDLVEAGQHYRCTIDLATGEAAFSIVDIDGTSGSFSNSDGTATAATVTGQTPISGRGTHSVRFANVDNGLMLWVDGNVITFDGPRTPEGFTPYLPPEKLIPEWSENDLGDLAPAGIGSQGADLKLSNLRVLRDIYYIAGSYHIFARQDFNMMNDYDRIAPDGRRRNFSYGDLAGDRIYNVSPDELIRPVLASPKAYREGKVDDTFMPFEDWFINRRHIDFDLEEGQFFTMGDNSSASLDARIWGPENFVDRKFLVGKALFIYWPHPVKVLGIPFFPNFSEMGFVR